MVSENEPTSSIWEMYKLNIAQLPFFMGQSEAETVLFIAKTAAVLKKTGTSQVASEKYTYQLASLLEDENVDTVAILDCLLSMKKSIGGLLFDSVTRKNVLSNQFLAFRAIYLTGKGSFMDDFFEQQARLKEKMDASFVPININDLNQVFKNVFNSTFAHEKWASEVYSSFNLIEPDQSVNTSEVFGTSVFLYYNIKWPLNLILSSLHIERYNDLFYFFCTIKKIHRRLVALNHQILNRSSTLIPNSGLVLCSRQLFFLNSLWSYIQMDLVDCQMNELVEMAKEGSERCDSLEVLAEKHELALEKLVSGCFLDNSSFCKKISGSIREIFACINKTCSLVERSFDEYQRASITVEHYDSLVKELDIQFSFLFQVFKGIQDSSSRTLLGQFLIRFDFNQWFSIDQLDR